MSNDKSTAIRTMVTAILIAEYQLISLVDGTHNDLKLRFKNAIASCRRVQEYFMKHPQSTPETRATFKQEFLGDEILLLSELLKVCFGLPADSIEDIIDAIKKNTDK
jgi:hypothetical protein